LLGISGGPFSPVTRFFRRCFVGESEAILDKRPVLPRKKRSKKKRTKRAAKPIAETAKPENGHAAQVTVGQHVVDGGVTPVEIEQADPEEPEAVTFFSKFKNDEILIEQSKIVQLGTNKYVTLPAKVARFNNHTFTTEDKEVIDYIRNPRNVYEKFNRFGREVFEIGVPEHERHIHRLSDAGVQEYLTKLHLMGRKAAQAEGFPYES
jgi:hypothetical protein